MQSKQDILDSLNISKKQLNIFLYGKYNYYDFEIQKKNGHIREISAPNKFLKYIQQKIVSLIEYKMNSSVHGYVESRSIVTNAINHVNKRFILNLDLKDFFPSITYARVKGLFVSYFKYGEEAAGIIANLITHNGFLPQGAPSSPIISNIICYKIDTKLQKYCDNRGGYYTRYADDITISWDHNYLSQHFIEDYKKNIVNSHIVDIIEKEDFKINEEKTRLSRHSAHKEVTGIIVNEKLNANKHYYFRLRGKVYAWEHFGIVSAAKRHCEINKKTYVQGTSEEQFRKKTIGELHFYKMIVGFHSNRYVKLATRINTLMEKHIFYVEHDFINLKENAVFLVTNNKEIESITSTGTGFRVKNMILTCNHIDVKDFPCFKSISENQLIPRCNLIKENELLDYKAYEDKNTSFLPFYNTFKPNIEIGQEVYILGYPDYEHEDEMSHILSRVTGKRKYDGVSYFTLDRLIQPGLSGAPVIDVKTNHVLGMIILGHYEKEFENGFMDIKIILNDISSDK